MITKIIINCISILPNHIFGVSKIKSFIINLLDTDIYKFCSVSTNFKIEINHAGVNAVFHYQPLHRSPAGIKFGSSRTSLPVTDDISSRLIRLPLWIGFNEHERIVETLESILCEF